MATILYPTRAGDTTYRNQDWAMAMAQDQGADLLLLYVSNVRFLNHVAAPKNLELIEAELDELGEFLLAMAQERTEKAGRPARTLVRHGSFREALKEIIQEEDVSAVVLGHPAHETAITTADYLNQLAQSLSAEMNVDVYIVHEGEEVDHYRPG
jgi:nucleotide-binding universal stress UspA family protein